MSKLVTPPTRSRRFLYPPHPDPDHNGHPRRGRTAPLTPPFAVGGPDASSTYRLARSDSRNIKLQRRTPAGEWVTLAYCGNSPRSITRAVSELAAAHWRPGEDDDLGQQLADLRRAIESLETTIQQELKL